jgi:hypothetical protein
VLGVGGVGSVVKAQFAEGICLCDLTPVMVTAAAAAAAAAACRSKRIPRQVGSGPADPATEGSGFGRVDGYAATRR